MKMILPDDLVVQNDSKIIFLIIDGVGGLPFPGKAGTEMQVADIPNMDELARESLCGVLDPVSPGITPGSGPGHFALFGYDPVKSNVGRGVLAAAGIGFELTGRDLAARINFATIDSSGNITDRRAGRIDSPTNERLCAKIMEKVSLGGKADIFVRTVKEHRALLVIRADNLSDLVHDTDPQETGVPPLDPEPLAEEAEGTCALLAEFISRAREALSDEPKANMVLLRGFAKHRPFKSMKKRFGLSCLAIANYPMYRGIASLIGMTLHPLTKTLDEQLVALRENYGKFDFFFFHVKDTDARGEDGDFDAKVAALEKIDAIIPEISSLNPDVLVVTGDHSTPASLAAHSWHPVPAIVRSGCCRPDTVERFDEISCLAGGLGRMPTVHLMPIALANAHRLAKFGA